MVSLSLSILTFVLALPGSLFAQTADPGREFLDGHRATFSTKGHPKAKGVVFTIAYPNSWAAAEGEHPDIVQKFVSEQGHGLEMAVIITKQIALPADAVWTDSDLRELFNIDALHGMLPSGAIYVGAQSTEIEGSPAGILEYTLRAERAGMVGLIHAWTLNFVYDKTMVQIQFAVTGLGNSEAVTSRQMTMFKPLFVLMANSIVFPEKWNTDAATSKNVLVSPASSSNHKLQKQTYATPIPAIFIVSFIITWTLGLTLPLIVRYIVRCGPVSKKTASLVAAGFSAFFWVAFSIVDITHLRQLGSVRGSESRGFPRVGSGPRLERSATYAVDYC